jgi:hypothetical protein
MRCCSAIHKRVKPMLLLLLFWPVAAQAQSYSAFVSTRTQHFLEGGLHPFAFLVHLQR